MIIIATCRIGFQVGISWPRLVTGAPERLDRKQIFQCGKR
jgi:hypothetical protein